MEDAKLNINKEIQNMINKGKSKKAILKFVSKNKLVPLSPKTLGMLFEVVGDINPKEDDLTSYFSKEILISDLKVVHPSFESTNGCQWARSDGSYLGKKYMIKRIIKKNQVYSIKLDGPNINSVKKYRAIRQDIKEDILAKRCVILDTSSNIEVDHKNGKYNDLANIDTSTQKVSDFQPLCKAANDAKREHCKKCQASHKRYDARNLGYSFGWIAGDEDTQSCIGCYWYDIRMFNEKISAKFAN